MIVPEGFRIAFILDRPKYNVRLDFGDYCNTLPKCSSRMGE
jgi:hypothetical protein